MLSVIKQVLSAEWILILMTDLCGSDRAARKIVIFFFAMLASGITPWSITGSSWGNPLRRPPGRCHVLGVTLLASLLIAR